MLLGAAGEPRPGRGARRGRPLLEPHHLDHAARPARSWTHLGEVESDEREARLQRDLRGAERLHRIQRPRPQQAAQVDPGRPGIERIGRIDQRAQLARPGGGAQGGAEQRGSARAGGRDDLVQLPPDQASSERRVQPGNAGRQGARRARRDRGRPAHLPGPQQVLERARIPLEPSRGQRHPDRSS